MLLRITIVLAVIFFVPMICHKVHIPSIVGFILVGMLLGPYGVDFLSSSSAISVLGRLGILYIMFQSGSEIDLNEMKEQRQRAIVYGIYSFVLPFALGLLVSRLLLSYDWNASLLLGAMYGSHTLMTYPIVTRYGVQRLRSVNIVVGGTMFAITLSLLILALVQTNLTQTNLWMMAVWVLLSLVAILWLFPKVAQWFLKTNTDPVSHFMLIMLMLVLSAWLVDKAGLDAILGAFLCGLALNRFLPSHSSLMRRINFMGNSVFVPMFLLGVGMLIDIRVFLSGWYTLSLAAVMIATKLLGKWLAAAVVQRQWHLGSLERQLIFGLTHAAAAGTLAIVSIGYEIGVLSAMVLNASVLMILVLCTVSSFVTERASKLLALQSEAHIDDFSKQTDLWRIVSPEGERQPLTDLAEAAQLKNVQIVLNEKWSHIQREAESQSASLVVYRERQPLNTISRLLVAVPRYAEKEGDFLTCFGLIRRLSGEIGADVVFYANSETEKALRKMCQRPGKTLFASFRELDDWEDVLMIAKDIRENDMIVLLSSRTSTASYNPLFREIPSMLEQFYGEYSYLVVYPEQMIGGVDMDTFLMDIPQPSHAWSLVGHVKLMILKLWRTLQHPLQH